MYSIAFQNETATIFAIAIAEKAITKMAKKKISKEQILKMEERRLRAITVLAIENS